MGMTGGIEVAHDCGGRGERPRDRASRGRRGIGISASAARPASGSNVRYDACGPFAPRVDEDRALSTDIERVAEAIRNGAIRQRRRNRL